MINRRTLTPLVIVETYLWLTLLIYFFGPVHFKTHNPFLFLGLMAFYLLMFAFGYVVALFKIERGPLRRKERYFSKRLFYVSFLLGVVMILGTYRNIMLTDSFIPYDIFKDVARGISEPGLVYTERMSRLAAGETSGSRLFNVVSLGFSFTKLFFLFVCLYFWSELDAFKKVLAVCYSLLFLSTGFASGTNAPIFLFTIFSAASAACIMFVRRDRNLGKYLGWIGVILCFPVLAFGYVMSKRGGGFDYFSGSSPLGDVSVSLMAPELDGIFSMFFYSLVWLNYYLVQGYYGFSLVLNFEHNWTYGFGSSVFLQRQFEMLFGIDISNDTFQARVSHLWDVNAQWHSFYGQVANDVGLIGVGLLMFLLGFFLCKVWISSIYQNSFYGLSLLPIFCILIIFIPANNQVFGYIDTFSYAVLVSILWLFEDKTMRFFK